MPDPKPRPASRARFAAAHPILTVHFDQETYARVVDQRSRTGLSLNQLVRMALGSVERHVDALLEQGRQRGFAEGQKAGYDEGRKDGYAKAKARYGLTYPCGKCRGLITIRVGDADAQHAIATLVEEGWCHGECLSTS